MLILLNEDILTRSREISCREYHELQCRGQLDRKNLSAHWEIYTWNSKGKLKGRRENSALNERHLITKLTDYSKDMAYYKRAIPPIIFSGNPLLSPDHKIELIGGLHKEIPIKIEEAMDLIEIIEPLGINCLLHNIYSAKIFPLKYHCHQSIKDLYEKTRGQKTERYKRSF